MYIDDGDGDILIAQKAMEKVRSAVKLGSQAKTKEPQLLVDVTEYGVGFLLSVCV